MTDAFIATGFRIAVISEPPTPDTPLDLFPPEIEGRKIFLADLFFVLEAS